MFGTFPRGLLISDSFKRFPEEVRMLRRFRTGRTITPLRPRELGHLTRTVCVTCLLVRK